MVGRLKAFLSGEGLAARAGRGTLLTVANFAGSNVLRLVSNLLLTRLLFPEAFGLMALVQVFLSAATMFSDIGLSLSVVQHKRGDDPGFIDTAWTLQVIRGALLTIPVIFLAPSLAGFYDEPQLAELLPVASLALLIAGFIPSRVMTAGRHLILGRLTILELSNQMATILVTVALAWWLQSVWALVWGNLIGGVMRNFTLRLFMPGRPDRFAWDRDAVRDMIGFGKFVFLATLATFVLQNGDRALLGKFVTLELLGIYAIALSLASVPTVLVRRLAMRIIFPLYSRRPPQDSDSNRRKIFYARYLLTAVAVAGSLALVLVGDPLIRLLYDPRYHAAGGMTVLVAVGALPMIIVATYGSVLLANNRSGLHAILTTANAAFRLGALYLGIVQFGVVGAALAPAIATLVYYPFLISVVRRYRAWDPLHDAGFAVIAIGITGLAWWLNAGAIMEVPR